MHSSNFGPPAERRDPFAKKVFGHGEKAWSTALCCARIRRLFCLQSRVAALDQGPRASCFCCCFDAYFTQTKALKCCIFSWVL